ncbi:MAG: rhodanese-like domain-containing protein [Desulfuromonas sp.]|uniref:rhodanese-like domain-containing protein n=1 Tax=Desulfuromonas sp. TaxID=892 RepID=UPI000CB64521|nr:rhodanese-like domain-containing protein [Desulfuromonas sp.]PLX85827.1 MAG: rhodanese-like domain-containing protein [Desulfuromonas sp.]
MYKRLFLVLLLVALSGNPALAAVSKNLSAAEARALVQKDSKVFLLDVRSPAEYAEVRIAGSRLIPIAQLLGRLKEVPTDRPILVYCAVGSRSSMVSNYLAQQGYPEVYNMYGGIWGWQLRGFPVDRGGP